MMPYQSYELVQAGRPQTARALRESDRRRGEIAATFGGLLHPGMLHHAGRPGRVSRRRRAAARLAEGLQH